MINKAQKIVHQSILPISTPSPISFSSRGYSPISSKPSILTGKPSQYKSPQTTPTKDSVPDQKPSVDQIYQCYSRKKLKNKDELITKLSQKLIIRRKKNKIIRRRKQKTVKLKTF
jgi:hypothetical protein